MAALAAVYASRMLGLFLLLPVLALYARDLPDYSPEKLGLAMGAYGLTQALLQIPFGMWSDRFGRKPVITIGLLLYALGSLVGALGHSLAALIAARSIQGAGAVSAAVTALLADLTRVEVRTRAMAFIGISIGLSFVLALVAGPVLDALIGVPGIFMLMLALAAGSLALLHLAVPSAPVIAEQGAATRYSRLWDMLRHRELWPLYFGILALHFVMTATFLSVPQVLEGELGIASPAHWKVYLGVFIASLAGTVPMVLKTERARPGPGMFALAIVMLGCAQAALGLEHSQLWPVLAALAVFFAAFNYLEARLPALLTQLAPGAERGAALGIFATAQFLGAFLGGALGGVLLGRYGLAGVFWGAAAMTMIWLLAAAVSWPRQAVSS